MKMPLLTSAFAALLVFVVIGAPTILHAQTTNAAPMPTSPSPAKPKPIRYEGKLTAIDASGNSITVTGTKHTLILALTSATSYKVNKKAATLTDFAVGDKVTGSYTKDATGAMTAHSLHKTSGAKSAAKASAAAPATAATPTPAQ